MAEATGGDKGAGKVNAAKPAKQQPSQPPRHRVANRRFFRSTIRGTAAPKQMRIADYEINRVFDDLYEHANALFYYLTVFAPASIKGKELHDEIGKITQLIETRLKWVNDENHRIMAMLDANGIQMGAPVDPFVIECTANTKLSTMYFNFFQKCDNYLAAIDTVWIEDMIKDQDKNEAHNRAYKHLHEIYRATEACCRKVREIGASKREKQRSEAESAQVAKETTLKAVEAEMNAAPVVDLVPDAQTASDTKQPKRAGKVAAAA